MSMIEVETAYDGCWEDCPIFEIEDICTTYIAGLKEGVIHRFECKFQSGCNNVLDYVSKRVRED